MGKLTVVQTGILRWFPLVALVVMAIAYEPLRSDMTFENQPCEWVTDWERVKGSITNLRHVLSFGLLCLVAALTLRHNRTVIAATGTFLFSAFLEFEQSFFVTGHCRSWDLIPNLLGIGLAIIIFQIGRLLVRKNRNSDFPA